VANGASIRSERGGAVSTSSGWPQAASAKSVSAATAGNADPAVSFIPVGPSSPANQNMLATVISTDIREQFKSL
jgi:hypothetical protein